MLSFAVVVRAFDGAREDEVFEVSKLNGCCGVAGARGARVWDPRALVVTPARRP